MEVDLGIQYAWNLLKECCEIEHYFMGIAVSKT